jgi:hypothetical protein
VLLPALAAAHARKHLLKGLCSPGSACSSGAPTVAGVGMGAPQSARSTRGCG